MNPWWMLAGLVVVGTGFVVLPRLRQATPAAATGQKANTRTDIRSIHPVEYVTPPLIKKRADAPLLESIDGSPDMSGGKFPTFG